MEYSVVYPDGYDPRIDGWDTHRIRYEPTVDELLAQRDELDADIEF